MSVLVFTVFTGLLFPLTITGLAQALFPWQAKGSLVENNGHIIGSELIAQGFTGRGYFHSRPSAAGSGYDPTNSGGTNLGPTSARLIDGAHNILPNGQEDPNNFDGIRDLAAIYRSENGLPAGVPVPADAVTRSASGLDPDISPANARLQADRIARARGLSLSVVQNLIRKNTLGRALGLLGEPRVNVLELNLALGHVSKS
jgi:K+-transporting ATPase ATPase C chain